MLAQELGDVVLVGAVVAAFQLTFITHHACRAVSHALLAANLS